MSNQGGDSVAADIEGLRDDLRGLRAEIKSLLESYHSNNVEVQQGLTSGLSWQNSHEKIDEERWDNLREKLSELKGMLETIPIKVEEDLRTLRVRIDEHSNAITMLKGVWLAVSVATPCAFALLELYLHMLKGG